MPLYRNADRLVPSCLRWLVVVLVGGCLAGQPARAQSEGGTYRAEVGAVAASQAAVPFWLHANRHGLVAPSSSAGVYTRLAVRRERPLGARAAVSAGGALVGRAADRSTLHLGEAYLAARFGVLRAHLGRKRETVGTVAGAALSSGSLGTSPNATPVPKLALASDGYLAVPLTRGLLEVKGYWAEGWLGRARYVENPRLHQKTAYVRVGGDLPVRLYGGLVHNALWGGTSPQHGRLPGAFTDYVRTALAMNADEDAPEGERAYIQGDHLGMYDVGLEATLGSGLELLAYRHFVYEDRDNLKLKSPQDGLLGVALRWREGRLLQRVVYEHLYTKWQNGPIGPDGSERGGHGGRDNYYNHYVYRSGWTYHGRTIGTPLLTPAPDTQDGGRGIVNNRVVGHHVGVSGVLGEGLRYRLLATYTRNYGLYEAPLVGGRRDQWSMLVEARTPVGAREGLELLVGLAFDRGDLYDDSVGLRLGLAQHGAW